ncbi:MAG: hypothetical protein CLLPBCKN_000898 [Chroococcidiopsis cubana SAG 39.79]|nr:hypothetical protein [Chroococcidiopsis cubana SAG 39.79]
MGGNERQKEQSMRARVEIVIRDEAGNILSHLAPHEIDLGVKVCMRSREQLKTGNSRHYPK